MIVFEFMEKLYGFWN